MSNDDFYSNNSNTVPHQNHNANMPFLQGSNVFYNQVNINSKAPKKCPRCNNLSTSQFCTFCGLDLVRYYSNTHPVSSTTNFDRTLHNQPPVQPMQYGNFNAPYPHPTQTKKPLNAWVIIFISLLAFTLVFTLSVVFLKNTDGKLGGNTNPNNSTYQYQNPNKQESYPNGISEEEYIKLKYGMSYAQVSSIAGGDGSMSDQGKTPHGDDYFTYTWIGENNVNALIHITFIDGVVSDIVEDGLLS